MLSFNEVVRSFQKQGWDVTEDEAESLRGLIYADAISPQFVRKLVQEYGDEAIRSVFLIPQGHDKQCLEYLLRRYKGHFYRNRYPTLTIVDT